MIELESLAEDDPARIVAEAFATMEENPPSGIDGRIVFEGLVDAPVDPAEMTFAIAVDEATGDSSFSMNFADMAGDDAGLPGLSDFMGEMSIVQVGDRAYVRFPFFNALLGVSTPWISMPADEQSTTHNMTPVTPSDPQAIFEAFEVGDATVERIGDETLDGVSTEHFQLIMDVEAMRERAEDAASFDEALPATSGSVPMDVWIDGDRRVVKLAMTVDGDQTDSDDEFDSMTMSMLFLGHGEPVVITPPPADQVTDIEDAEGLSFDG